MKKYIVAVALILFLSSAVGAWEYPNNPDRFPSVGLQANYQYLENFSPKALEIDTVGVDTRLPVSQSLTLSVNVEGLRTEILRSPDFRVYRDRPNLSGYKIGVGLRYYFNSKAQTW